MKRSPLFLPLAVLLAVAPLQAQENKTERERALAEIKRVGGTVVLAANVPGNPVVRVDLWNTDITDAGLARLSGLKQLEQLDLWSTAITDDGLVHLKGLTQLKWLRLRDTKITDTGLVHLQGLTRLEKLDLGGTRVTDAGVEALKKALPRVTIEH